MAIAHDVHGPNFAAVSACATGAHSIGVTLTMLRAGEVDVMHAGGTETTITPLVLSGYLSMGALSKRNDSPTTASRPFDREREGFVMSEGAVALAPETALAVRHGVLPPTIDCTTPDPDCPLDLVPNEARAVPLAAAISNLFGFGGQNRGVGVHAGVVREPIVGDEHARFIAGSRVTPAPRGVLLTRPAKDTGGFKLGASTPRRQRGREADSPRKSRELSHRSHRQSHPRALRVAPAAL